ncbi:MAG: polyprenyl synthetase family protein, partial [Proteobacteria bacterium]
AFLADDLTSIEQTLAGVMGGNDDTPLHKSALHLLSLSGKRLRPLCVALAARLGGGGFGDSARAVAVAVELVHNATLLHDDVVDVSDVRRGSPTARVIYGNAASVYAGDWLLIDALQRLESCGRVDLMVRLLAVLREMLDGEALQLDKRGNVDATVDDYFRIVRGKTASLFRFALHAGGAAGNVAEADCQALGDFGEAMGVAFQITDDVLDLSGAAQDLGKNIFADLHEGKFTLPLLLAMERAPSLRETLRHGLAGDVRAGLDQEVLSTLESTGALADARAKALSLSTEAMASLGAVADSPARKALEQVAVALVHRTH